MSDHRTVLVAGATGRLGAVAGVLTDRGHEVRALSRAPDAAPARALRARGIAVVHGDFDDPATIQAAARGVDAAFFAGTAHRAGPEGEARHGRKVAGALGAAGVPHVVFASGEGADRSTGLPVLESKLAVERQIAALGLPATVLAPVYFMENVFNPWNVPILARGRLPVALPPDEPLQQVAIADVVRFAVLALERPAEFIGRRVALASDELTGHEAAEALSRVLRREVPVEALDPETLSPGLRALFGWLEREGHDVDVEDLRARYPEVGWHRYDDWAREQDWRPVGEATTADPSGCAA